MDLGGAFCNPKPVQQRVPLLIGGRALATLRIAAEHADVWNIPGGDLRDYISRSATLDRLCTQIGRDPAEITRSMALPVSYDDPAGTRTAIAGALEAGFTHIVLILPAPYPDRVVHWVADELVHPSAGRRTGGPRAGRLSAQGRYPLRR